MGKIMIYRENMQKNIKEKSESDSFRIFPKKVMDFILNYGSDLFCILDNKLRYNWINKKLHRQILGYNIEDLQGKEITDFIYEYDKITFLAFIQLNFSDERKITIRFYNIRKRVKWITIWILPYEDEEKNKRFILILKDITEEKEDKEKLVLSEKKFYQLFEESPFIIIVLNKKGVIVNSNKRIEQYGYTNDDILGKKYIKLKEIIPDEYLPLMISSFKRIIENKEIVPIEAQLYDKNRNLLYVHMDAMIVNIEYEEFVQVIIQDIDEKKKAQLKLEESERKYRNILQTMSEAYYENDLRGNFTYVNKYFIERSGYPRKEIIGKNYGSFFNEEEAKALFEQFSKLYRSEIPSPITFEGQWITPDGKAFYFEGLANLRYDPKGNKIGFYGLLRDITERKKAEHKLEESEKKYRKIVESAIESYFELDIRGNFTYINEVLTENLGYKKREEIIGKNFKDFFDSENTEYFIEIFSNLFKKDKGFVDYKGVWIRGDGVEISFEGFAGLRLDENNQKIGFYGLARNT